MKWTSWAFLAFVGSLMFLMLFIKDWEIKRGIERLSKTKLSPQSQLQFSLTTSNPEAHYCDLILHSA
jgi:hypothetical protein